MIQHTLINGKQKEVADDISVFYNHEQFEVINIIYSTSYDDLFAEEPTHHAIVYYKDKTA